MRHNHWVSKLGPFDRCAGCTEEVPNASERGPVIITGDCRALSFVPPYLLRVCSACLKRPPYFGQTDECRPDALRDAITTRPGWCMLCQAWMGDASAWVRRSPPVVDLVSAFLDAAGLAG